MNRALKMVPGLLEHGPGEGSLVVSLDGIFAQKGCRMVRKGLAGGISVNWINIEQGWATELQPKLRT